MTSIWKSSFRNSSPVNDLINFKRHPSRFARIKCLSPILTRQKRLENLDNLKSLMDRVNPMENIQNFINRRSDTEVKIPNQRQVEDIFPNFRRIKKRKPKDPILFVSNKSTSPHTYLTNHSNFPKPRPIAINRRWSKYTVLSPSDKSIMMIPISEDVLFSTKRRSLLPNLRRDSPYRKSDDIEFEISNERCLSRNSFKSSSDESFDYIRNELTPKLLERWM